MSRKKCIEGSLQLTQRNGFRWCSNLLPVHRHILLPSYASVFSGNVLFCLVPVPTLELTAVYACSSHKGARIEESKPEICSIRVIELGLHQSGQTSSIEYPCNLRWVASSLASDLFQLWNQLLAKVLSCAQVVFKDFPSKRD